MKLFALLIAASLFVATSAQAEVFLGSTELSKKLWDEDTDVINLGACRGNPNNKPVTAVQIRVKRNDIYLESIVATFGNGQTQEFHVREKFRRNSQSRWIDLRGNRRCITSFRVVGRTEINFGDFGDIIDIIARDNARVELYGRRIQNNHDPVDPDHHNGRVRRIGRVQIKYGRSGDFQRHSKYLDQRGVRQLQIGSRGGRYKVRNFKIHFCNGSVKHVNFRQGPFRNGQFSRWINLGGRRRGRCIERVSFRAFSPNGARMILRGKGRNL